jgi:Domain of unknown function (DUF3479)
MIEMWRNRKRCCSFGLLAVVVVLLSSLVVTAFLAPNASPAIAGGGCGLPCKPNTRLRRSVALLFSSTLDKKPETESSSSSSTPTSRVNDDARQQQANNNGNPKKKRFKIVLVAGFESFNRGLYQGLNDLLDHDDKKDVEVTVFADSDIRLTKKTSLDPNDVGLNPVFARAVQEADSFIGSLIFDYDDVLAVKEVLPAVQGPRVSAL